MNPRGGAPSPRIPAEGPGLVPAPTWNEDGTQGPVVNMPGVWAGTPEALGRGAPPQTPGESGLVDRPSNQLWGEYESTEAERLKVESQLRQARSLLSSRSLLGSAARAKVRKKFLELEKQALDMARSSMGLERRARRAERREENAAEAVMRNSNEARRAVRDESKRLATEKRKQIEAQAEMNEKRRVGLAAAKATIEELGLPPESMRYVEASIAAGDDPRSIQVALENRAAAMRKAEEEKVKAAKEAEKDAANRPEVKGPERGRENFLADEEKRRLELELPPEERARRINAEYLDATKSLDMTIEENVVKARQIKAALQAKYRYVPGRVELMDRDAGYEYDTGASVRAAPAAAKPAPAPASTGPVHPEAKTLPENVRRNRFKADFRRQAGGVSDPKELERIKVRLAEYWGL